MSLFFGHRVSLLHSSGCQSLISEIWLRLQACSTEPGLLYIFNSFSMSLFKRKTITKFYVQIPHPWEIQNITLKTPVLLSDGNSPPCFMRNCYPKFLIKGLFSHVSLSWYAFPPFIFINICIYIQSVFIKQTGCILWALIWHGKWYLYDVI